MAESEQDRYYRRLNKELDKRDEAAAEQAAERRSRRGSWWRAITNAGTPEGRSDIANDKKDWPGGGW